jgi:hypothetical protein
MEDFGYKKNNDSSGGQFFTRKIFFLSGTLLSLSIFIYISLKAYNLINKNKEIETIKGPSEAIKVYEENDYNDKNGDRIVNRSIYDDIFGNRKDMIQEEIKIKKNSEPALPPKNIKQPIDSKNSAELTQNNTDSENAVDEKSAENNISADKSPSKNDDVSASKKNPPIINIEKKASEGANNKNSLLKRKRSIRVQISAMSSKENCEEYYKKLSRLYPNIFSRTKYYIETADLGKRGVFYRLQVGDFFNQVDAEEFCSGFISQTQKSRSECIIVE